MPHLIQDWVIRQASERPESAAIVMGEVTLSYGELDRRSNQLARLLRERGCRQGDRIALCLPKSPQAVIALVAALKADCVYVPVDVHSPAGRLQKLLDAAEPTCVIAADSSVQLVDQVFRQRTPANVLFGCLEDNTLSSDVFVPAFCGEDIDRVSADPVDSCHTTSDPAHIFFTSGSTGTPKGVVITHANVIGFVQWCVEYFRMNSTDRVSGHSPLHFDLSTFDIFGAFAAGATLYPVPAALNLLPHKLRDFIREHKLTQWFSVPSVLNYLFKFDVVAEADFPDLRRLMWCGEVLSTPTLCYLMKKLPAVEFTNLYGPTETTIASSYYTVPQCPASETQPIPIGQACGGEQLIVLDDKLQPTAAGEIGHLYISGVGLSPGYWRDDQKTNEAFPADCGESHQRIYRTGDLARQESDGMVYFVGRADTQIKSRGYRIELGEIETALNALPFLKDSAVVAIDSQDFGNKSICCAWVSANPDTSVADIRRELLKAVPRYMCPHHWMEFDRLPRNANGKTDRPRLRSEFTSRFAPDADVTTLAKNEISSRGESIDRENTPRC